MRRKDKEITDRAVIDEVIKRSEVLHLGLCKDNKPYVIPLCYGYDGECLYFHSAKEGMKVDYIEANPNVCFEIVNDVALVKHKVIPCKFTFAYKSVIGFGKISEVTDKSEKGEVFKVIMRQYSDKVWNIPAPMIEAVKLWKIGISEIYGKQSQ